MSRLFCSLVAAVFIFASSPLYSYSVLAHEAIVDAVWEDSLVRVILLRFPQASDEDLRLAHAYAYGGSIIQDMGYYPFGSHFFTDLTHYVRSGDFVRTMLRDSGNIYEYAFALGALAHYSSDNNGHRLAINPGVPLLYPKLQRKFGNDVTYEDSPSAHLRTEFGLDVLQVARGRYVIDKYRSYIGFEVAKDLLIKVFRETYGLELDDVFGNLDLAVGSYRRGVGSIIPKMTKVAWELKKDEIQKSVPGVTRQQFLYNLPRSTYEKEWGTTYRKPGVGTRLIALLIRVVPKIGPFSVFQFRTPTPEVERLFEDSLNATVMEYRSLLAAEGAGRTELVDANLDVGKSTSLGSYRKADKTYAKLLDKLADQRFAGLSSELRANILAFYENTPKPTVISRQLERLRER